MLQYDSNSICKHESHPYLEISKFVIYWGSNSEFSESIMRPNVTYKYKKYSRAIFCEGRHHLQ